MSGRTGFEHTNLHDLVPYHKMTVAQGKAWCFSDGIRRRMASQLAKLYPKGGCGLCSAEMKLVAYVAPGGTFRMLVAPFKRIAIWQIANKPLDSECPCAQFFDPEVKGPWVARDSGRHHPMCQFQRGSQQVFDTVAQAKGNVSVVLDSKGVARRQGKQLRVRPDFMLQVQKAVLAK